LVLLNSMRLLVFGDWAELPPFRQARRIRAWIVRLDNRADLERVSLWVWERRRAVFAGALMAAGIAYATSGWTSIGPGEVGLLQRFGRYHGLLGPGLHLRWPAPIERVRSFAPDRARSLEIGFRAAAQPEDGSVGWAATHGRQLADPIEDEGLLLTGDGRYV